MCESFLLYFGELFFVLCTPEGSAKFYLALKFRPRRHANKRGTIYVLTKKKSTTLAVSVRIAGFIITLRGWVKKTGYKINSKDEKPGKSCLLLR